MIGCIIKCSVLVLLTGCSGIVIEPREDKLPDVKIKSSVEGCKWRPKVNLNFDEKELHYECEWEFSS